jgi:putative acetyltransferase
MSDISFRRASAEDAEEVLDIKREAIEDLEHWQYSPEQVEVWAPKESYVDTFEQAIEDDRFIVHVAEENGILIGYGALNVPDERIDAIYVRPDHHGKGIATALVKQLELSAEFQDIGTLTIMAALNAVPFYESVGYWNLEDEVTTIEDVDLELVKMRKNLDDVNPDDWFDADPAEIQPDKGEAWFDADVDVEDLFETDRDGTRPVDGESLFDADDDVDVEQLFEQSDADS